MGFGGVIGFKTLRPKAQFSLEYSVKTPGAVKGMEIWDGRISMG